MALGISISINSVQMRLFPGSMNGYRNGLYSFDAEVQRALKANLSNSFKFISFVN